MTAPDFPASSGSDNPAMPAPMPWRFWATLLWSGGVLLAWGAMQVFVVFILFLLFDPDLQMSDMAVAGLIEHAVPISLVTIAALPAQLGVIWLATRTARWRFADYLALTKPPSRDLVLGFICLAILLPLADLVSHFSGRQVVPDVVVGLYVAARDSGALWLLALALIVAAPVGEELVFRGFMFRGFAASKLGVAGAIALPALLWTMLHLQYDSFYLVHIFVIGLLFGWLRWRSGSVTVPLLLHALVNLVALLQAALVAARQTI